MERISPEYERLRSEAGNAAGQTLRLADKGKLSGEPMELPALVVLLGEEIIVAETRKPAGRFAEISCSGIVCGFFILELWGFGILHMTVVVMALMRYD